jgi:hypothetical protein
MTQTATAKSDKELKALKEAWYRKGAQAFKLLMQQESDRILAIVDKDPTVFSKGQADGIRWLRQSIEELLGFKFEA